MCYPSTPAAGSLANGSSAIIYFDLEGEANKQNALTQAIVKVDDLVNGITFQGPVYAEIWLVRSAGLYPILLDCGFVQGGAPATVIGLCGGVMFTPGDQLVCKLWNDSGAAFIFKCQYSTDHFEMTDVASCQSYTKLSTRHEANFSYETVILNDGANAGAQNVAYAFADGLRGGPLLMTTVNQDTAARYTHIYLFHASGIAQELALNATLGAGGILSWPAGTTYVGIGIKISLVNSISVTSSVDAVAVSQDSTHIAHFWISSRPPTITITKPVGATSTPTTGSNEVR